MFFREENNVRLHVDDDVELEVILLGGFALDANIEPLAARLEAES